METAQASAGMQQLFLFGLLSAHVGISGQECRMKIRVKLQNGEEYLPSAPLMLSKS